MNFFFLNSDITLPSQGEFADSGTETHFFVGGYSAFIRAVSSGNKMKGLLYSLKIEGAAELEPVQEILN